MKKILWSLGIIVILGSIVLPLISYGPIFVDEEFEQALDWAEQQWFQDIQEARDAPFSFVTRAEAAQWYVSFAQSADMILYSDEICEFNDIWHLTGDVLDYVMLSCGYRFFRWAQGAYAPDVYLTKAGSLVALMKGFYPTRDFGAVEPYREPFVQQAYDLWITKRESDPYMMYLMTRYELLLQLYRAYRVRWN